MMKALIYLFLAMLSIQYGSTFAKSLFSDIGPAGLASLRITFAAILLLFFTRPWNSRISREDFVRISLYGSSLGLMNLTFYLSLERIPLGIAVALEFVGPLCLALFGSRKPRDILWVSLAAVGVALLVPWKYSPSDLDPLGAFWALLAGFFWASYIFFGKRTSSSVSSSVTTSVGMLFATALVLPIGAFVNTDTVFDLNFWPMGLAVAFLSSALPYTLEMKALRLLPQQTFSILMSMEPVVATLMGYLALGEVLTSWQWLAIICIGIASAGSSRS